MNVTIAASSVTAFNASVGIVPLPSSYRPVRNQITASVFNLHRTDRTAFRSDHKPHIRNHSQTAQTSDIPGLCVTEIVWFVENETSLSPMNH